MKSLLKSLLYKAGYSVKKIHGVPRRPGGGRSGQTDAVPDVMGLLHQTSPYAGFDFNTFPFDARGWGGQSPAFRELIAGVRPNLILEVGTWKGASALEMAAALRDLGLDTKIVCVDTWLGALEFWTDQNDPERYQSLRLRHGFPSVYYQFLANVCHKGFQDRIIPFPQTSATAALWFRRFGITADMIYVDASHEEEDVYQDLCSYWEIVSDRGLMFGDDYSWDGVRLAVQRFAREEKRRIDFLSDKWVLHRRVAATA
jgi:predicted O-methyltransferase YrrM